MTPLGSLQRRVTLTTVIWLLLCTAVALAGTGAVRRLDDPAYAPTERPRSPRSASDPGAAATPPWQPAHAESSESPTP